MDLMPENDRNEYSCPSSPRHMSVAVDKFDYRQVLIAFSPTINFRLWGRRGVQKSEIAPKSLFLCINGSPFRYSFPVGMKQTFFAVFIFINRQSTIFWDIWRGRLVYEGTLWTNQWLFKHILGMGRRGWQPVSKVSYCFYFNWVH